MSRNSDDSVPVLIAIIAFLFCAGVFVFSRKIGAEFVPTLQATLLTIAVIGVALTLILKLDLPALKTGAVSLPLIWPAWWRVLDSIANPSSDGLSPVILHTINEDVWWTSSYLTWGVEAFLVALAIFVFVKSD